MKNILLLTDFSNNALNAIHYAMLFFKGEICKFHIINIHKAKSFTSDDLMYSTKESIYDSITREPQEKLNKLIEDLKNEFQNKNHSFTSSIDFDVFTDAVNQAVKKHNIDYIVIGSNGATGAKEIVFGSNTINVMRKVNCKTIVIPEGYIFKPIKKSLLVLDRKDSLNGNAFDDFLMFTDNYKLNPIILRVQHEVESSNITESDISNLSLTKFGYQNISNVPIHHAVSTYLQINAMDFVCLFAKKERIIERIFSGSSASKLSKCIKLPLVIFKD